MIAAREVHFRAKRLLNCLDVCPQSIGRDLDAILEPARNVGNECVRGGRIALAHFERWHQFRLRVYGAERPSIAQRRVIAGTQVALFLADESPDFIDCR